MFNKSAIVTLAALSMFAIAGCGSGHCDAHGAKAPASAAPTPPTTPPAPATPAAPK